MNWPTKLGVISCILALASSAHAGIPVIDFSEIVQSTISAVEDVNQAAQLVLTYKNELAQYERMLTDGVVPAVYLWDNIQQTISSMQQARADLAQVRNIRGLAQDELKKLTDLDYYRSSNCYNSQGAHGGCYDGYRKLFEQEHALETVANDSRYDLLDAQDKELDARYDHLQQLQQNAATAKGQLEAVQYGNQLASAQITELMDTRALLISQQRVEAEAERKALAKEAAQTAASTQMRDGKFQKSPERTW
jgi:P-type conjugative transfer protein TrbJ